MNGPKNQDKKFYEIFARYLGFGFQLVLGPIVLLVGAQWLGNKVGYKTALFLTATVASLGWMIFQAIRLNEKSKS